MLPVAALFPEHLGRSKVLVTVPLRALLEQFAEDFPDFCKVGTGYNQDINLTASGFLAVTDSVRLLKRLEFDAIFVDEAHHPRPAGFPKTRDVYRFSATHRDEPDFRYSMGQAMEDRILCDYDLTVPVVTRQHGHTYLSLADLLLKQAGRFRRVLAYCNSVREAKNFRLVLRMLGMAAWHMNGDTRPKKRKEILEQFASALQKPVHVLVTVEVLGEGINIPNADTCMFVEPRGSYRSIVQAMGRVLRPHSTKPLAHIILPAVALTQQRLQRDSLPADHVAHGQRGENALPAFVEQDLDSLRADLLEPRGIDSAPRPARDVRAVQGDQKQVRPQMDDRGTQGDGDEYRSQGHHDKLSSISRPAQAWQSSTLAESSESSADNITPQQTTAGSSPCIQDLARADAAGLRGSNRGGARLEARTVVPASTGAIPDGSIATAGFHKATERLRVMNADVAAAVGRGSWASADAAQHDFQQRVSNAMPHGAPKLLEVVLSKVTTRGSMAVKEGEGMGGVAAVRSVNNTHIFAQATALAANDLPITAKPVQSLAGGGRLDGCQQLEEEQRESIKPVLRQSQRTRQQLVLQSELQTGSNVNTFGSELQRFFAALLQADHRLLGRGQAFAFAHRVRIVDCTLLGAQHLCLDEVTHAVYAELAAVLRSRDLWELRFRDLEKFVAASGRLPREASKLKEERSLGIWLTKQGVRLRAKLLLPHRFHQLLNSSSPLVRERAQGWLSPHQAFEQKCQELRGYVQATGSLSLSAKRGAAERKLALWLYGCVRQRKPSQTERKMLEEIHPSMKAKLRSWASTQVRVQAKSWKQQRLELLDFISREGRLPGSGSEPRLYSWLSRQRRRCRAGMVPGKLALELQRSHPLIAQYFHRQPRKAPPIA